MRASKTGLYDDLKRRILTLDLRPDADIDEQTLSDAYGLSRTPVREVLQKLAGEGYVDIRENRGSRVAPMDYWTLRNFFLAAPMIYAAVGRLATQNFTAAQMADLKEAQKRFRKASQSGDADGLVIENNRFHEIIGEMAGNVYLLPSVKRLLIDHARIGHTFFRPRNAGMLERKQIAADHHDGFIEAIGNHDEHAVVELVFEHWELSRKDIELFIAPEGLKADALVDGPPMRPMEHSS